MYIQKISCVRRHNTFDVSIKLFVGITTPLYSFCGDLAGINNYLLPNYFPHIPNVKLVGIVDDFRCTKTYEITEEILKTLGLSNVAYAEDFITQHNFIKHLKLNSFIDNRNFDENNIVLQIVKIYPCSL